MFVVVEATNPTRRGQLRVIFQDDSLVRVNPVVHLGSRPSATLIPRTVQLLALSLTLTAIVSISDTLSVISSQR